MATPTYRDTVGPSLIDVNMPSNGRAEAAQALANTFRSFSRAGFEAVGQIRAEQGRREGAEAGRTDHPGFRTGMAATTAYGRAYNDTATRSYAIKSEIDADEAATRLENEAGNDPEHFRLTFGARRDETLKNAPPEARAILSEVYDRRMAAGMQRLIGVQSAEIKQQSRADLAEGVTRATDRIGQLRASNDPNDYALAEEETIKQNMLIDGALKDGTLSATEASVLRLDAARAVTQQTVTYKFRNEMDNPYGDPVGFIMQLKEMNKSSNALPPQEEEKLVTGLLNELQERNALTAAGQRGDNAAQKARWELGDNYATNSMISGKLTANKLSDMLQNDEIDPSVARTLYNDLKSGNDRPDDAKERFSVETTLLEHTEQEIGQNSRLSWQTRRELIAKRRELANGWRGTQQAREGADRIDRALGIVPGSLDSKLLSDDKRKQRETALTAWYDVVDGLPENERQAAAITKAEEITNKVIRNNNTSKLDGLRRRLEQAKKDAGPIEDMGEETRKTFEADIARREAAIRALEQQVK